MTCAALPVSPVRTISFAVIALRKSLRLVKGSSNTTILSPISGSRLSWTQEEGQRERVLLPALIVVSKPGSSAVVFVTSTSLVSKRRQ